MSHKLIQDLNKIDLQRLSHMYARTSLGERPLMKLQAALNGSSKVIVLEKNGDYIGAGRTISDGIYTLIVDLAVIPEVKGQGFGKLMMDELLKGEDRKFVYLNSTFEAEGFYQKLGFKKQKTGYAKYPFESEYLEE